MMWVCGKVIREVEDGAVWEFQGIFTKRMIAVAACRDERYFVGPVPVNEVLPDGRVEWPGAFFPMRGAEL